jgi:hypothetical protein
LSTTAATKLSKAQRTILAELLDSLLWLESQPGRRWRPAPLCSTRIPLPGLRRRSRRGTWGWTRAESAGFSRALRCLEARGLVLRTNITSGMPSGPKAGRVPTSADQPHRRSDHLYLTDLGRPMAQQNGEHRNVSVLTVSMPHRPDNGPVR